MKFWRLDLGTDYRMGVQRDHRQDMYYGQYFGFNNGASYYYKTNYKILEIRNSTMNNVSKCVSVHHVMWCVNGVCVLRFIANVKENRF